MIDKGEKLFLRLLFVFSFCAGIGMSLPRETTLHAANKQTNESDKDALATAQHFEHVFEQLVEQVKPAVVSITSVKVFKHTQQKKEDAGRPISSSITRPQS